MSSTTRILHIHVASCVILFQICRVLCNANSAEYAQRDERRPGDGPSDEPRGPLSSHEPAARPAEAHRRALRAPARSRRGAFEWHAQYSSQRLPGGPAAGAPERLP